jgi:hypothetical protein
MMNATNEISDEVSVEGLQIVLRGAADHLKIAASVLRYARDLMTPEQAAQIDFDFDKGTAEGFELADKALQMAEELKQEELEQTEQRKSKKAGHSRRPAKRSIKK